MVACDEVEGFENLTLNGTDGRIEKKILIIFEVLNMQDLVTNSKL